TRKSPTKCNGHLPLHAVTPGTSNPLARLTLWTAKRRSSSWWGMGGGNEHDARLPRQETVAKRGGRYGIGLAPTACAFVPGQGTVVEEVAPGDRHVLLGTLLRCR